MVNLRDVLFDKHSEGVSRRQKVIVSYHRQADLRIEVFYVSRITLRLIEAVMNFVEDAFSSRQDSEATMAFPLSKANVDNVINLPFETAVMSNNIL